MNDGVCWADVFASSAENYALVWVDYCAFFAVFFFELVGGHVAEVDTFAAGYAFFVVDFGVPGDFASGDSFVFFYGHFGSLFKVLILLFIPIGLKNSNHWL